MAAGYFVWQRREARPRHRGITDEQSRDVFVLRDAVGEVLVKPSKGSMSGTRTSVSRFEEAHGRGSGRIRIGTFEMSLPSVGDRATLGHEYDEWVLLPAVTVFVAGEATDAGGGGELVRNPVGADDLVVSTRSEDELVGATAQGMRTNQLLGIGAGVLGRPAGARADDRLRVPRPPRTRAVRCGHGVPDRPPAGAAGARGAGQPPGPDDVARHRGG